MNSLFRVQLLANRLSLASRAKSTVSFSVQSRVSTKVCLRSPIQHITFNKFSTEQSQPVATDDAKTLNIKKRVDTLYKAGKLSLKAGKASDAETSFLASEQGSKLLNDIHTTTLSQFYLGYCKLILGSYEKAISYFQQVLPALRDLKQERLAVLSLQYCAESAAKQNKFAEAVVFAKEALAECQRVKKEKETLAATVNANLASYLASDGKLEEAIPFAEDAVKDFSQHFGSYNETTRQAGLVLAKLYKETGNEAKLNELVSNWASKTQEQVKVWESKGESALDDSDVESLNSLWKKQQFAELLIPGFVLPKSIMDKQVSKFENLI